MKIYSIAIVLLTLNNNTESYAGIYFRHRRALYSAKVTQSKKKAKGLIEDRKSFCAT